MKTTRLRAVLRHVEPAVVRVVDVPASTTLPELHELLQATFGWTDSHLHQFVTPQETYGMEIPDEEAWPEDQRDEAGARLADLGAQFEYLYDFGDCWTAELLDTLADPAHPDYGHLRSWVGDRLRPFDRAVTNLWLRQAVGEVPESVRLLLDLVADGVKLTPGGRLPRTVVRSMQQHRPHWHPLGRPAAIEDDLPPLAALHDLLRGVGLLRLRHGVLAPTRVANDDLAIVRRLRSAFDTNTFATEITELTIGVLAAHGPLALTELAAQVHELLGRGWQIGGRPVSARDVQTSIAGQSLIMSGLDLIDNANWRVWAIGASARSLLPGATMLAQIWSNDK